MTASRRPAWTTVALLCAACGPPESPDLPEFGELAWVGEHLEVWTTPTVAVCEGSFEHLDRHAGHVIGVLQDAGVETRTDPYRYFWTDRATWMNESPCRELSGAGCAIPHGDVYVNNHLNVHETVHAAHGRRMHTVFSEGVAVVFGDDDWSDRPVAVPLPELFDASAGQQLKGAHYEAAGIFARLVLENLGAVGQRAMSLTDYHDGYAGVRDTMAAQNVDLDALVQGSEQAPECGKDGYRIAISECMLEPTPWLDPTRWETQGTLDCADADTLGPSNRGEMWTVRTLDVAVGGDYSLVRAGDPLTTLGRLVACDRPLCEPAVANLPGPNVALGSATLLTLQPGRYWIRVSRDLDDGPGDFAFQLVQGWVDGPPPG